MLAAGCAAAASTDPGPAVESSVAPVDPPVVTSPTDPTEGREPQLSITEPELLASLEGEGFGLSAVLGLPNAQRAEELSRSRLGGIFRVLREDVLRARAEHPVARVTPTLGTRLFDVDWFQSKEMRFKLVGIFNRLDRRPFYEASCGEVRFVYRLAYETVHGGEPMAGKLPLTLNVVFLVPGADCREVARSWFSPAGKSKQEALAWLRSEGALAERARGAWSLKALETNLQTVRIQSTAHPSMGGHIEYSLRVFHRNEASGEFAPAPLENTPDVERLAKEPELKQRLLAWLRSQAALVAADEGRLKLPDEFNATRARSVSPRGLLRIENRPFTRLFGEADFEGVDLSRFSTIASPAALLRRLDGQSCAGCHQSRPIAGFHHVGEDGPSETLNALAFGSSAHVLSDLERREKYVRAVARAEEPKEFRPHSERQGQAGTFGAPCGLGDPGFRDWTCSEGLRCEALEDPKVGICVDDEPVGAPCASGRYLAGAAPKDDRMQGLEAHTCDANACWNNKNAFPQGSCRVSCDALGKHGVCLDFQDTDALQGCLIQGKSASFCGSRFKYDLGDRACDKTHPCRQDYVCARVIGASNTDEERGACIPPYFVVPLRLDGYPLSKTRDLDPRELRE
jgi:hypothetical protein